MTGAALNDGDRVLEVTDLETRFNTQDGTVFAVNGISFYLHEGEVLGVVGESGSGKSVSMLSLLRLIPTPQGEIVHGSVMFDGQDLLKVDSSELRKVRGGEVGFVFQDPMNSLNPVLSIGKQIVESLRLHTGASKREANDRAKELLELVGLPDADQRLSSYPHELSGGMRQRVMIAMALACSPKIIIADEPTTALDVTVQAQIIEIVRDIQKRLGTALIWITHDLAVIAGLADRVLVMYAGRIVEEALVGDLYTKPRHPYTKGLLESVPRIDQKGQALSSIEGQPPNMYSKPTSCSFAPRCAYAFDRCHNEVPKLRLVGSGHRTACFYDLAAEAPHHD